MPCLRNLHGRRGDVAARASALAAALAAVSCFSGDATVGAICGEASDCGPGQQCRHELCGRCGNGSHESGELCYADPIAIEGAGEVKSFRVADLDANGRDELFALDVDGRLRRFAAPGRTLEGQEVALPEPAAGFALGDADGDGRGDIVVFAGATITALIAGEDGTFAASTPLDAGHVVAEATVVPMREAPGALLFVDDQGSLFAMDLLDGAAAARIDVGTKVHVGPAVYFDDDEFLDIAIVDERQNRMGVVAGPSWDRFIRVDVGRGPTAVVGYDRDGDGRHDFLTLDRFGHTVTLVASSGEGDLRVLDSLAFATAPLAATAFDADFDRTPDVFVGTDASLEFWRGESGRNPEGVTFADGPVDAMAIAQFGAAPVFEILTLAGGVLRRRAVDP